MLKCLLLYWLLACTLLSRPALALQPGVVVEDAAPLFDETTATLPPGFAPHGFGSSTIFWDARLNRFILLMEYQAAVSDPACPHALWGLAISRSLDPTGATGWSPPQILYEPVVDGSYKSCVAAHPSGLWGYSATGLTNYRSLFVAFKAEQDMNVCPLGTPVNDCVFTGIGLLTTQFTQGGALSSVTASPNPVVPINRPFGFQSPLQLAGSSEFYMLVQVDQDIFATRTNTPLANWAPLNLLAPVMSPGTFSWAMDEMISPEPMCSTTPGELVAFVGGRTWGVGTNIVEAGWSEATSSDNGQTWVVSPTPIVSWYDNFEWRHWTAIRVSPFEDYLIWFVRKNPATGNLSVWRATALTTGTISTPVDRRCP